MARKFADSLDRQAGKVVYNSKPWPENVRTPLIAKQNLAATSANRVASTDTQEIRELANAMDKEAEPRGDSFEPGARF